MARATRFLKESQTEFAKAFRPLGERYSSWKVWADFVALAAIAIANRFGDPDDKRHQEREKEYLNIMKRYTSQEQEVFPTLFSMTVKALDDNPEQDYLGEMFMGLELGNHWTGQFFTPYHVCQLMAAISMEDVEAKIERQGWIGIMDCACGAGALLIAARNHFYLANPPIGYLPAHLHTLFVCQDVDRTAALMCYIQLSLLGCAGYVVVGNSLTNPTVSLNGNPVLPIEKEGQEIWCMPMFHDQIWVMRQAIAKMDGLIRATAPPEVSEPEKENTHNRAKIPELTPKMSKNVQKMHVNEPKATELNVTATGQLTLF